MDTLRFAKGHGTGNDFVILPDPDGRLDLTPSLVAALCDRRRGIGADGVLRVVRSAKHPDAAGLAADAEWFMDYRNADGSVAEMCGNGVRVFARYLLDGGLADGGAAPLPIATRAGVVHAAVTGDTISVEMRPPVIGHPGVATLSAREFAGTTVDCGNPHLVCGLPPTLDLSILDLARPPRVDPQTFPNGANVEFVSVLTPLHVRMRVHERGVGETLSCGTGALAVAAVILRDAARTAGTVHIELPGGDLTATATPEGTWHLAGPAVLVAHGETSLARQE